MTSNPRMENNIGYVGKISLQKPIKLNTIHSVLTQTWTRDGAVKILETAPGIIGL